MLEVWFTELHALFRLGCSRELRHRSRSKGQLMSLQAWDRLMLQCKLYNKNFGQLQGTLVFTRSVMRVDNDIKERVRATCLAFPDFVEALCRVRWPRASVRTCVAAVEQRPPPPLVFTPSGCMCTRPRWHTCRACQPWTKWSPWAPPTRSSTLTTRSWRRRTSGESRPWGTRPPGPSQKR